MSYEQKKYVKKHFDIKPSNEEGFMGTSETWFSGKYILYHF